MSFRSLVNMTGAVAGAKIASWRGRLASLGGRIDEHLPLGLKLGGLVAVEETPFILLASQGLLVTCPQGNLAIKAYGTYELSGCRVHRFYLEDETTVIQVSTDARGAVIEEDLRLFQQFDEVNPASDEEWGFWLDEADGYIGYPTFESQDKTKSYTRLWGSAEGRVDPLTYIEKIHTNPSGKDGLEESHEAMLYGRNIPGTSPAVVELMLLSAVQTRDSAWISIDVGCHLDPMFLRVL